MSTDSETSPPLPADGDPIRPRILVGLGNPGEKYVATRHNVGFRVVEELARRWNVELGTEECHSRVGASSHRLLVMPLTYMNRSGFAARCLMERRSAKPDDFLVIYDEVHLQLGALRMRPKGSPAGHRGLESVLENLGTDQVPRLRLGVGSAEGPPQGGDELVSYVLGEPEPAEAAICEAMILRAADACEVWIEEGVEATMQKFNGPPPAGDSPA